MFHIVETENQLEKLKEYCGVCFINLISNNDNYHPKLAKPCALYIRLLDPHNKGYLLSIDHSEGFSLSIEKIKEVLSKYKQIFCLDSKYHSYFIDLPLTDINYLMLEAGEKPMENKGDSIVINSFYNRISQYPDINKIIPLSKLYEYWEEVFFKVMGYVKNAIITKIFYSEFDKLYKEVEEKGIGIDTECFGDNFTPHNINYSYQDGLIYTQYNLYNTTCRPTNAFNGINFLAINKENQSRKCFIPRNDCFIEIDFDGYHVRLVANLIKYKLPGNISIHTYFGQQYFDKEILTEEEYQMSKQITFQNIYGNISKKYIDIPFFKKLSEYLDKLKKSKEPILLPTGKYLKVDKEDGIQKTFNYVIQNLETKVNVELLSEVIKRMEGKKSFINLIVYDSFLIDFSLEDGKDFLKDIVTYLQEKGYNIKAKYGKNYNDLIKTNYL